MNNMLVYFEKKEIYFIIIMFEYARKCLIKYSTLIESAKKFNINYKIVNRVRCKISKPEVPLSS